MIRIVLGAILASLGVLELLLVATDPNFSKGPHGESNAAFLAVVFLGLFVVPGALLIYFGRRARRRSKAAVAAVTPEPARGLVELHLATTGKESVSLLIAKLRSSDVDVRAAAAEQLGQLADPVAVQPLVDLIHEEGLRILRGTLGLSGGMVGLYGGVFSAQGGRFPVPAVPALAVVAHEHLIWAGVLGKAADAFCRIGAPAVPALIQMLQDPDDRFLMLREEAARVLGELKTKEAVPALVLEKFNAALPCAGDLTTLARAALEQIGGPEAEKALAANPPRGFDSAVAAATPAPAHGSVEPHPATTGMERTPAPAEALGSDKIERLLAGLKEYDDALQVLLRGLELGYARSVLNADLEYLAHLDLGHMLTVFFNIRDPQQLARFQPVLQSIHSRAEAAGKFIEGGARIPTSAQEIVDRAMQLSQTSTPYPQALYMIIPNILMVTQSCLGHAANVLGSVTRAPSSETAP